MNDLSSLYDILDLKPDASPQEVREAYLRTKAAYNKDSVALYTLIGPEEREDMLNRIEEAYDVLSNSDRRKDYDRNHGHLDIENDFQSTHRAPIHRKIISIDRVPPMDSSADSENLLVAPTTDFALGGASPASAMNPLPQMPISPEPESDMFASDPVTPFTAAPPAPPEPPAHHDATQPSIENVLPKKPTRSLETALAQEIAQEIEWKGVFLRKVREARRISIEELSNITKVSKTYLTAIEEENFAKLPAAVFLRGFVSQFAKVLKLPPEQVTSAYMARYYQARPDKNAK